MRIIRFAPGHFALALNKVEAVDAIAALAGQLAGVGAGGSTREYVVAGGGLQGWLSLTLLNDGAREVDEGEPAPVVLRAAVRALLKNRDFLGYQLSHANGNLSEEELDKIAAEHLADNGVPAAVLERRAAILFEFLEGEIDSDVLSAMLECDGSEAARMLLKLRGEQ